LALGCRALKHAGWILDLYHKAGQMIVWLKKTDGSCVRLTDPWKPKIHVGGSFRDLLDLACRPGLENAIFVERYEKAGDRERTRVLEVEVDGDREAVGLARKLEQFGRYSKFRFYDIDIPSPQMYLYRKGLFPLAFVEAEETNRGVSWTLKDSRESIDYQLPHLREIGLEIKTEKIRKIRSFDDKLASVHFTRDEKEILALDSGDEVDKILGLVEAFRVEDPDVIMTHGGDSFIFPYLARRAQELGILDQLILGRDISPLRVYEVQGHSYFSYGKILYRETAARLLGRLHVDQNNAYVSADCGLEGLFEVSRTCIMPIQRASRATIGTNMTSLQLYHAVKRDVLIPWNKNQPEELKNSGELVMADRGGFIYQPDVGIHDNVGELDFASLYPTLMTQKNLSGETVNCTCCPDSANRVPELEYNICERWAGIVPLSLKILLDKRARYKTAKKTIQDENLKTLYDRRQAALKWILVCCLPSESPVLISQNGEIGYQQIGKVVDQQLGDDVGVFDCRQELFVAGVDKNLKSKFCRVSKLIKTPSPEKLLTVRMDDGRQVKCTANHSFYVLRGGRLVEINAENLSKGDLVPVAKRIVHNTTISRLDLLERVRQEIGQTESDLWRAKGDSLRAVVNSSSNTLQVVLKNEGRHIQNLEAWRESGIIPFRYLDLLSLPEQSSDIIIGRGRRAGGHVAWLPASLDLDEDLGFFLGFYVADGSAGENFIRLDVGGNESEIVDHLTDIIKAKFGLTARLYKEPKANMFVLQVNSVSLVQILNRIFELPSSSATGKLKVPPFLFSASQEAILGFISGLVTGDGSVNKDRDHISIATHSYDFAVQIGYLALHLGIPFNIIKGKRLHRIYFVGPNGLRPFKELFLKKKHRTRFETIRTSCHADCRHAIFEMFPVEQSGLKEIATLTRTVRTPRLEGRVRVCPERARRSLQRIAGSPHSSRLRESHSRIMKLLDSDIGFVAVKEIEQIESSSPFVYCFEISDDENFPAFFTGTGGVLVHNSFGYLGFKNARFGKIDAHIATCAFSRKVLGEASAIAEAHGFELVHGIVDSFWLRKSDATREEYEDLCKIIRERLGLPISFEGTYKWIVFLSSKTDSKVGVLNRYYGIFEDGKLKIRGIDLRRHDTPEVVSKCQDGMLDIFTGARDSSEFRLLIPKALRVLEKFVFSLREGNVSLEDLVIVRNLSKNPDEYTHQVPQAIAARHLVAQGGSVHAGQQVSYILTTDQSLTALPPEVAGEDTVYDSERYVDLLCSSAANLLLPLGYDAKYLRSMFRGSQMQQPVAPRNRLKMTERALLIQEIAQNKP
jgi:DNA polymerase elongation subunit (family B)